MPRHWALRLKKLFKRVWKTSLQSSNKLEPPFIKGSEAARLWNFQWQPASLPGALYCFAPLTESLNRSNGTNYHLRQVLPQLMTEVAAANNLVKKCVMDPMGQ